MAGLPVKKGDTVVVVSGRDRGARGRVILTLPKERRVIVEGINRVTKHEKMQQGIRGAQEGGLVHQEAPIHVSNVMVVCGNCGKPARTGHRDDEEGRSVRICRRCGADT